MAEEYTTGIEGDAQRVLLQLTCAKAVKCLCQAETSACRRNKVSLDPLQISRPKTTSFAS